jgi:hypothetical protein
LPAQVELAVALQPAAVGVDLRQVVPDALQVRRAGLVERLEQVAVGAVRQLGQALLLGRLVQVDGTEQPVAVGAPASDAGGARLDVRAAHVPHVGHGALRGQHAGVHGRHPGHAVRRAVAERREGRLAMAGQRKAVGQ